MVVLLSASKDGHIYLARNYDFGWAFDDRLCTVRVSGHPAHIGFALQLFGRADGMNEHGLCVTTSMGGFMQLPQVTGLVFVGVVRAVLDQCRDVDEALALIQAIPIADCRNFILADKHGSAALVEVMGPHKQIVRVGPTSDARYLCATNHYALPEMVPYDQGRTWHSVARYNAISSRLDAAHPIDKEGIRGILSDTVTEGVCCHHYSEGMGTLWSMILDPMEGKAEVCFGSPNVNPWRTFGLQGPSGVQEYGAKLPDEPAAPAFWRKLPPGGSI